MKGHLKRNRMTQISASEHLPLWSKRTTEKHLDMIPFFAKVNFFIFWLKTVDYNQGFCSKLSSFLWSFYSKVEGTMKLKFAQFCSPC